MRLADFQVGVIVKNRIDQFAKLIFIGKNGNYGFSGWTSRENAEKATVAHLRMNRYGIQIANLTVVSGPKSTDLGDTAAGSDGKPTKSALGKMKVEELTALCKENDLPVDGTKKDLLARLFAHFQL